MKPSHGDTPVFAFTSFTISKTIKQRLNAYVATYDRFEHFCTGVRPNAEAMRDARHEHARL